LKIPVTFNTECKPFCLAAKCLNNCVIHLPLLMAVHIEMRRLELLGNMCIMDENNVNWSRKQEVGSVEGCD
jgi:hypothetical protein